MAFNERQKKLGEVEAEIAELRRLIIDAAGTGLGVSIKTGNYEATHQFIQTLIGVINISNPQVTIKTEEKL